MKQIRFNTFETNSSSTHSLVICTEKEFKDIQSNKTYIFDNELYDLVAARKLIEEQYPNDLPELDELIRLEAFDDIVDFLYDHDFETYNIWEKRCYNSGLECYEKHFITPSGDKMVVWGHYGYSG